MPSFQCRKLLTESEVFNQEAATCVEEAKNGAEQESKGLCHAGLLSRFACGTQRYILLKSQADRILANDRPKSAVCSGQERRKTSELVPALYVHGNVRALLGQFAVDPAFDQIVHGLQGWNILLRGLECLFKFGVILRCHLNRDPNRARPVPLVCWFLGFHRTAFVVLPAASRVDSLGSYFTILTAFAAARFFCRASLFSTFAIAKRSGFALTEVAAIFRSGT